MEDQAQNEKNDKDNDNDKDKPYITLYPVHHWEEGSLVENQISHILKSRFTKVAHSKFNKFGGSIVLLQALDAPGDKNILATEKTEQGATVVYWFSLVYVQGH